MALVEVIIPKMGESIVEATILPWLKKPGDVNLKNQKLILQYTVGSTI